MGDDCVGADDWVGAEDCAGADDCTGAEETAADETELDEAGVLDADVVGADALADGEAVLVDVDFGLGFLAGAFSAGTALALTSGAIVACCATAALGAASDPDCAGVGAELFLTADPMANAAPSPTTRATTRSSQRLRTSWLAGAAGIAATSP